MFRTRTPSHWTRHIPRTQQLHVAHDCHAGRLQSGTQKVELHATDAQHGSWHRGGAQEIISEGMSGNRTGPVFKLVWGAELSLAAKVPTASVAQIATVKSLHEEGQAGRCHT